MVALEGKTIFLDTSVFIYHFESHREFGPVVKRVFELLSENKAKAVTSVIAQIELLSLPMDERMTALLNQYFWETPNLVVHAVDQEIASKVAKIRRKYGFRTPDAIHLATAVVYKADVFITNDKRLKKFDEMAVALVTSLLTLCVMSS